MPQFECIHSGMIVISNQYFINNISLVPALMCIRYTLFRTYKQFCVSGWIRYIIIIL